MYGLSEKQFHLFFNKAERQKGITGTNLLVMLERRVDIPSFVVKIGDTIEVREKSKKIQALQDSLDAVVRRGVPQWLDLEKDNMKGMVKNFPIREDLTMPIQEQLIVELYSK
jgi:small subunit ribosomal protein S4